MMGRDDGYVVPAVGLSPYHLSRLFKAYTGLTQKEYRKENRR